ncbi:endonuclease/exonuclease/phosphatase family metal-dependent hydrolase [Paenibacillus phyllosphaerae]|uniref:Endonuclease/exonuclease/phosphatase family metal-dependent hydrolase n=1 Tax=Paenibacillus phyllosphaerae TaxID=274593 RepID=A0A7W5FNN7_9BACL|nr:jacalin-like lectin [Paenibacillus phyllosphaerae]MBB3111505.1 endonuclease/exonuclease/phosphatase family metal-dependent hydrolase [Paenibacillus phyllosphaerae]
MPKWRKMLTTMLTVTCLVPLWTVGNAQPASAATGSFDVLSYNIGGLPDILSSSADPEAYTPQIGAKLAPYELVNVQEDFNYHASLYASDTHPYRTPTSGGAGIGSGLNTLSNYPYSDLKRVTWNKRYGLFDNGSDELTPKGFTYTQVKLADGAYVDVYNLHADANTDTQSNEARRDNLSQLATYIEANSQGHAVLVLGDTNCRYTRAEDNLKALFVDRLGMKDAWIEKTRGGSYPTMGADALLGTPGSTSASNEVVDKIFYRSGAGVTLQANSYKVEDTYFTDASGNQLSDHYAISANLSFSTSTTVSYSDLVGGDGGTAFNFLGNTAPTASAPASVTLRGASRLDAVSMTYANGTTLAGGGTGGTATSLTLASGEYFTSALIYANTYNGSNRVFYLELTTNQGRKVASGTKSGTSYTYTAPTGSSIAGFFGRAGENVDKLGLIYKKL